LTPKISWSKAGQKVVKSYPEVGHAETNKVVKSYPKGGQKMDKGAAATPQCKSQIAKCKFVPQASPFGASLSFAIVRNDDPHVKVTGARVAVDKCSFRSIFLHNL